MFGSRLLTTGALSLIISVAISACRTEAEARTTNIIQVNDRNGSAWGGPAAAITHDGIITIAWTDTRQGLPVLRYTTVKDNRVDPSQLVASPPESFRQDSPYMIADEDDGLHLVWTQWSPGGGPYYAYYGYKPPGESFWQTERLDNGLGGISPRLAVDEAGYIHAVWEGLGEDGIFYRQKDPAGNWSDPENVSDGRTANLHVRPAIAVDDDGHVHVAWHGFEDERARVFHAVRIQTGWCKAQPVDPGGPANQIYARLVSGVNGRVYLAWEDYRNGSLNARGNPTSSDIYFAVWTAEQGWSNPEIANNVEENWNHFTAFLTHSSTSIALAWVEIPERANARSVVAYWQDGQWSAASPIDPEDVSVRQDKPILLADRTGHWKAVWLGGGELVGGPSGGNIYFRELPTHSR